MANIETYKVLREMEGDRFYRAGETRAMDPCDAVHLVRLGVLEPVKTKAESAPANKAAPKPATKAAMDKKA